MWEVLDIFELIMFRLGNVFCNSENSVLGIYLINKSVVQETKSM